MCVDVDIDRLIILVDNGLTLDEISIELLVSKETVKRRMKKFGLKSKSNSIKRVVKECLCCELEFCSLIIEERKFCSHSCAASVNNKTRIIKERNSSYNTRIIIKCITCGNGTKNYKYCSKICYEVERKKQRHILVESGLASSDICKAYLIEKYDEKCMECNWNERNIVTNKVPIEIEHIDGNSDNNNLDNLKLLCPNCHSLTTTYKALNIGNGRHYRKKRYEDGKSF